MASEAEGFGLAVIESAYYKTPIIVRDISVFREIAGENAFYFPNTKNPEDLANSLIKWLELYKKGEHPKPDGIKWLSWKEHTEKLKEIFESLA
jgi:glycosyltransferase involved in cell wall biosynthesis